MVYALLQAAKFITEAVSLQAVYKMFRNLHAFLHNRNSATVGVCFIT